VTNFPISCSTPRVCPEAFPIEARTIQNRWLSYKVLSGTIIARTSWPRRLNALSYAQKGTCDGFSASALGLRSSLAAPSDLASCARRDWWRRN
jgi:hypothetical protein